MDECLMSALIRRVLSRFLQSREEVRYIDFVEPPRREQPDVGERKIDVIGQDNRQITPDEQTPQTWHGLDIVRVELDQWTRVSDDVPGDPDVHPDDDWFAPHLDDNAPASSDPGPATPQVDDPAKETCDDTGGSRPSAGASELENLDPELVALVESTETPELDDDIPSAVTEVDEGEPGSDDTEWVFEDVLTAPSAAPPDANNTALPAWSDEALDLEAPVPVPVEEEPEENVAWRAGSRAAALIDELDLPRFDQRRRTLRWLEGLLQEFPHGASHAAIARLVLSGVSIDELDDTASIIRTWRSDSSLWLRRRFDRLQRQCSIEIDYQGRTALPWKQAAALVANVDVVEATDLLITRWRDAWLQLSPEQPGSSAYATFACTKIARAGQLDWGSALWEQDTTDAYVWLRRLDPTLAAAITQDGLLAYHALRLHAPERGGSAHRKGADAPAQR